MLSYKSYKLLQEKVSSTVYHKTTLNGALHILKENRFRLSAAMGTKSEIDLNKNKMFYFSVARSPMSTYFDGEVAGDTYFVIDGDKLNQNYKGKPVDYWGSEFRKLGKNEMEDRVFTDKQFIEPATKYIKELHILLKYEYTTKSIMFGDETKVRELDDNQLKFLQEAYTIAKRKGVPIFAYEKLKDYRSGNKGKAIDIMTELKNKGVSAIPKGEKYNQDKYGKRKSPFSEWLTLLNFPLDKSKFDSQDEYFDYLKSKLSDRAFRLIKDVFFYGDSDKLTTLSNDIHNYKSSEYITGFVDAMKKRKLKTAEDIIKYIQNKYRWDND